jgi:two-component system sensor histidine kinase YcbA
MCRNEMNDLNEINGFDYIKGNPPKKTHDKWRSLWHNGENDHRRLFMELRRTARNSFFCAALIALSSQVSVALTDGGFQVSVAVVLFAVLLYLLPEQPVWPVALLTAPLVFLLRALVQWVAAGTLVGCWSAHAPEMLFYLLYGLLFSLLPRRRLTLALCLPLTAIDALANLTELTIRLGGVKALTGRDLITVFAVGLARSALSYLLLRGLDHYGLHLLHREELERYRQLLLTTAALQSEMVWMEKGSAMVEDTMNAAYHLYRRLKAQGADQESVEGALAVAKDIHEIKKEYALVKRGIDEALGQDTVRRGMELGELVRIVADAARRQSRESGKDVKVESVCTVSFRTDQHYALLSILRNLLTNAIEAAPGDRPVDVALTVAGEGGAVRFTVADNCGGIPETRLPQIFSPGFSSKMDRETGAVNRGLGLPIVRDLAETKLGGQVDVASGRGRTCFTVTIPQANLEEKTHAALSD